MKFSDSILSREIYVTLTDLAIPQHMNGFAYLTSALKLAVNDASYLQKVTKRLYPEVAELNTSTSQRVERSMRSAIEAACIRSPLGTFEKYFGNAIRPSTGKPTNAMFIATISNRIRVELMSRDD